MKQTGIAFTNITVLSMQNQTFTHFQSLKITICFLLVLKKIAVNIYDTFNKIKVISMPQDSILCVPDASQNPIILNLNFAQIEARNLNILKIIFSELIIIQK